MTMNAIAIAIGAGSLGIPSPGFFLPFSDSGAGAVNLVPGAGAGAATFTRATSATCWSSSGLLLTVGTGVARSTYTELTGATYLGYLNEEARTNSCIQNRDFTNAAWVKTTMTAAKDQVGIDGAANSASSLLATAGNATAAQTITIAAVNRPFSVYVKRLVGTGNIDLAQDGASFTTQSVANDGAWHRCTLVASQLNPVLTIRLATNADKIAVDYAALEDAGGGAAPWASSPIATTTVAVTRNADMLSFVGTGNVNNATGSAYAEITAASGIGSSVNYVAIGTGAANGFAVYKGAGNPPTVISQFDNTSAQSKTGITDYSLQVPVKVASAWGGATMEITGAGLAPTSGAFDGTMGDGTTIGVGNNGSGGQVWNGTLKNVKLWAVKLSSQTLSQ